MDKKIENLKVAIVCDWLTSKGGAAKVEEAIGELFPNADVYTSVCNPDLFDWLKGRKIYTTWLNKIPYFRNKHQLFAWLRPLLFEGFDLSKYDVVISSSSAESKCVITKPDTLHICYCHTPIRYYWSDYHEYFRNRLEFGILNPLVRIVMPRMIFDLRMSDRLAVERVDKFVANSKFVASRIKKYYRRDSEVIYPPVDFSTISNSQFPISNSQFPISNESQYKEEPFYLFVGRLVPYKKADLVVEAFLKNGKKLKVIGGGPQYKKIKKMKGNKDNIEMLGPVSDDVKIKLIKECKALIFPSLEDFGIVPVEAMSYGKPVVAFGEGGATESVLKDQTGLFFSEQTVDSLNNTLEEFERRQWDEEKIKERAYFFRKERFQQELKDVIMRAVNKN